LGVVLTIPHLKKFLVTKPYIKSKNRLPRFFKNCRAEEEEEQGYSDPGRTPAHGTLTRSAIYFKNKLE